MWGDFFQIVEFFNYLKNIFGSLQRLHGASQVVLVVKNLPANAGDLRVTGLILGSGRSPGGGHGDPLQYSCLENPYGQRSLVGTAHGVAQNQTKLKQLGTHACKYLHTDIRPVFWKYF